MTACIVGADPSTFHMVARPQPGGDRPDFGNSDDREGDRLHVGDGNEHKGNRWISRSGSLEFGRIQMPQARSGRVDGNELIEGHGRKRWGRGQHGGREWATGRERVGDGKAEKWPLSPYVG